MRHHSSATQSFREGKRWGYRVRALLAALLGLGVMTLTGCGGAGYSQDIEYEIAGGNTSGIYYSYAEQLAHALARDLNIAIEVAETQGSVDNLERVASGDALLGFAQGDTAADALIGTGSFSDPLDVQAVARVYDEFVHVVVPADSPLHTLEDLAGRTVSLGSASSGVQVIGTRVLEAAGVDQADIRELGLDGSVEAMLHGDLDAFFWVGGLPTPGLEELAAQMPIRLLSIDADIVERVNEGHAGVYQLADFPVGFYGLGEPVVTMTVPNYLVTSSTAPDPLIKNTLRVLFESRSTIASHVTAADYLDRRQAIFTGPLELHSGAAEYYVETRR